MTIRQQIGNHNMIKLVINIEHLKITLKIILLNKKDKLLKLLQIIKDFKITNLTKNNNIKYPNQLLNKNLTKNICQ